MSMPSLRHLLLAAILCGCGQAISLAQETAVKSIAMFSADARILFQGDSITDGNRGRNSDPNHILGHGYPFIIAARHGAAFPERKLEFMNRGVSGNTTVELQKRWQADTLDLKPDVLSILAGANDSSRHLPLDEYEKNYDGLLTSAKAANPKIRLVLCQPFVFPGGGKTADYPEWRKDLKLRQEVVAKLAAKHGAVLVDFQAALDAACRRAPVEHWVWDGVHPTYSGHQILADAWERAVAAASGARP
jgi:lysophospholipase L1-like esterase